MSRAMRIAWSFVGVLMGSLGPTAGFSDCEAYHSLVPLVECDLVGAVVGGGVTYGWVRLVKLVERRCADAVRTGVRKGSELP